MASKGSELVQQAFPDINPDAEVGSQERIFFAKAVQVANSLKAQGLGDDEIVAALEARLTTEAAKFVGDRLNEAFEPFGGFGFEPEGEEGGDVGGDEQTITELLAEQLAGAKTANIFTIDELISFGLSPEEAQQANLRQFGVSAAGGGATSSPAALQNAATAAATLQNLIGQQPGQNFLDSLAQATSEVQTGISGFAQQSADVARRSGATTAASGAFTSIADLVARAGEAQARLGLDIASTPRNIFPAFFLSQGQDPSSSLFEMFNLSNLLGVDTSQFQNIIASALSAAQQAQDLAGTSPTIDIESLVGSGNITDRANEILAGIEAAGGGPPVEVSDVPEAGTGPGAFERDPFDAAPSAPAVAPLPGTPEPASQGAGGISIPGPTLTAPGGGPIGPTSFEDLLKLLGPPPPTAAERRR